MVQLFTINTISIRDRYQGCFRCFSKCKIRVVTQQTISAYIIRIVTEQSKPQSSSHPPREIVATQHSWRNCVDHLAALSHIYATPRVELDSNKANLTVEGHRLDNLPVPSMPWRPCTDFCFFLLNINYRQMKPTQLTL